MFSYQKTLEVVPILFFDMKDMKEKDVSQVFCLIRDEGTGFEEGDAEVTSCSLTRVWEADSSEAIFSNNFAAFSFACFWASTGML